MKKLLILGVLALIGLFVLGFSSKTYAVVRVNGYYKKSGTYVAPHYRSNYDSYKYNNYSTKGNTNPYTGIKGYKTY